MEANKLASKGVFLISIVASSLMELVEQEQEEEWELVVECNILMHITVKFRKGYYHRVLEHSLRNPSLSMIAE